MQEVDRHCILLYYKLKECYCNTKCLFLRINFTYFFLPKMCHFRIDFTPVFSSKKFINIYVIVSYIVVNKICFSVFIASETVMNVFFASNKLLLLSNFVKESIYIK